MRLLGIALVLASACSPRPAHSSAAVAHPTPAPAVTPAVSAPDVHADRIRVAQPQPHALVTSPLQIRGEARGTWFFEASFPLRLLDARGAVVAETHADARGEWMTERFVPFEAQLSFAAPATPEGKLVLMKDNPSDLPENADQIEIPIRFQH